MMTNVNQDLVRNLAESFNRGALAAIASSADTFAEMVRRRAHNSDDWREAAELAKAITKFASLADACRGMLDLANS